ncbi:MAG: ABC transporter substrate-binding protein [Gemmatimonadaceae bacterium]
MTRQGPVSLALMMVLFFAVPACEQSEPSARSRHPRTATKQELVVAAGEDEFGLELNRHRLGMYPLNANICEPLVRLSRELRVEPWLATGWTYRGNNTYRFTIRRNVKFHDGRLLDAAAVKYTLDRSVKAKTQYSFLSDSSVRVVDDSTVDITPAMTNLRVLEQLVHPTYAVIAPGSDPITHPVCTGPFRFVEYVRQNHLTVERNEQYWGEKAKLERITFRFIPDDNTRALMLRSGEVDAIFDVHRSMVAGLKRVPGIQIVTAPPGAVITLYLATRGTPPHSSLGDPALRRAIATAIDRKTLVEHVLDGHGAVVNTVNPPAVLGRYAHRVIGVPYDPAGAAQQLDKAGWRIENGGYRGRGGKRLVLTMITQPGAVDRAVAEYVQAQLAHVGVQVRIEHLDPAAFESRLNSGKFDLDIEVPNQNDGNLAFLLALRWFSRSNVKSAVFMIAGSRFDAAVQQALTASDHDRAQEMAAEAMHLLVDEDVAAIPLAGVYRIYAMNTRVRGFVPHPSKTNQWWSTVWRAR